MDYGANAVWGYTTAAQLAACAAAHAAAVAAKLAARARGAPSRPAAKQERAGQCDLLRDVVGNPFQPQVIRTAWRRPGVLMLARGLLEGRRFEDMPVLGDTLEAAGCDSEGVLVPFPVDKFRVWPAVKVR